MSLLLICVETITLSTCNLPWFNSDFFFQLGYDSCLTLVCDLIFSRPNSYLWILKLRRNLKRLNGYLTDAKSRPEILESFYGHRHAPFLAIISLLFFLCHSTDVLVELLIVAKLSINIICFLVLKPVLESDLGSERVWFPFLADQLNLAMQLHMSLVTLRILRHFQAPLQG